MVGPTPPREDAAERTVVGLLLAAAGTRWEPDALAVLDVVAVDDVYNPTLRAVYAAICDLHRAGHPHDVVAVEHHLRRSRARPAPTAAELLGLVHDVALGLSAGYYAELVVEAAARRRLLAAAQRIVQLATDPSIDLADAHTAAAAALAAATRTTIGDAA